MIAFTKWDLLWYDTGMNGILVILGALALMLVSVGAIMMARRVARPECPMCRGRDVRKNADGYSYTCEDCGELFIEDD